MKQMLMIAEQVVGGDRRALARAITLVENNAVGAEELLGALHASTGRAYRVGVTGPPGAGKSTLTNRLAALYRKQGHRVGIIAVDPTSPFTGGALLGDRVRMTDVELDRGVFIRSMASRGSLGGLSRKANEAADVLDAAGYDIILMETVGVGQSELDVASASDTTMVVLVPESGDGIQAMKAGLMEIADLFVMNKADRPGADQAVQSIQMILGFKKPTAPPGSGESVWRVAIVKAVASEGRGIDDVARHIATHRQHQERTGELAARRRVRVERRIKELVEDRLRVDFWDSVRAGLLSEEIDRVVRKEQSPYALVQTLLRHSRFGNQRADS
jgi:LAO/AO transport system kinase